MVLFPANLPETRMDEIAKEACEAALGTTAAYKHESVAGWNSAIIEKILSSLIGATEGDSLKSSTSPPYKFAVNSTIIQNIAQLGSEVDKATLPARRGMHSAAGAFWNNERDGFWSYKFAAGEAKGMDVVVLIFWIGL